MRIIKNAIVTPEAAYYPSGGIVEGTQRIPTSHLMPYWQQDNAEICLSRIFDLQNTYSVAVPKALYAGRIPTHFGHFLLEGLPRLCDVGTFEAPVIGTVAKGVLPVGKAWMPEESMDWILSVIFDSINFVSPPTGVLLCVDNLYVPDLPLVLSQSCPEPWRMSDLISKIIQAARTKHPEITEIESLYLRYAGQNIAECEGHTPSDPTEPLSLQIAKVSMAKSLTGHAGSNTHISMFARQNAYTTWFWRHDFEQTNRNQLICDLVKTFNTF